MLMLLRYISGTYVVFHTNTLFQVWR